MESVDDPLTSHAPCKGWNSFPKTPVFCEARMGGLEQGGLEGGTKARQEQMVDMLVGPKVKGY